MAMDLFSMLTDPKVLFLILAIAALAVFVYYQWRRTSNDISELTHGQKKLQKQLAHGVITDEKINPLKIDNASNMSEETMDYEYDRGQSEDQEQATESGSDTDTETVSDDEHVPDQAPKQKFIDSLINEHRAHHQGQRNNNDDEILHAHYGVSIVPDAPDINTIPGHDILDELRHMRDKNDIVIIRDNDYDTDSEEPIEFQDMDMDMDMDDADADADADADDNGDLDIEALRLMEHKKEQIVKEKIHHDIQRIDDENRQLERQMRSYAAQQRKEQEMAKTKVEVDTKPSVAKPVTVRTKSAQLPKKPISVKPKTGSGSKAKVTVKPTLKSGVSSVPSVPAQKIQPKIKNIGIKV